MSHRTRHLPETNPVFRIVRELRYHEASRQLLAIGFIILVAVLGSPSNVAMFVAGAALVFIGSLIRVWASGHVKKNKELATDGPYAFVRHPLYVGNILSLLGFVLCSQLWWSAPLLIVFLWFYYPPAISYEDRKLHSIFGGDWERWRATTMALVPGRPSGPVGIGGWSLRQSVMKNGEPLVLLIIFYCLYRLFTALKFLA
jgi:protein-S-isoprenylcysteine O-methyltransferase Ste14